MSFLHELKNDTNLTLTENGALTHKETGSKVFDMFALGGAYRNRSDDDVITLFKQAYKEDATLACRCLFYLRDCRGGQGERRFFRVAFKWLCDVDPERAFSYLPFLSEYGRWDDVIYATEGTEIQAAALNFIGQQFALDLQSKTPSLLAKWLPSENASSAITKAAARKIRLAFGLTSREYRKALSLLRKKINIVETLMSQNRWDEIEFDKIPSKAGLIYKNAFARRDIIAKKYEAFAKDKTAKVNADTLYPYEVAHRAFLCRASDYNAADRLMIQKYWDNLPDYYNGKQENAIAVVDTSGSMSGLPIEVAVSLGAYVADKSVGPFANHFITFSSHPELIEFTGNDITDKFRKCVRADWGMNTNIEAVFDMLLKTALNNNTPMSQMPKRLYIISDMEFDGCLTIGKSGARFRPSNSLYTSAEVNTALESIAEKWKMYGYELPHVIFWNVDARHNNIPMLTGKFSYISGFSPVMIETILSGKDGYDLMLEKLNSKRYCQIK